MITQFTGRVRAISTKSVTYIYIYIAIVFRLLPYWTWKKSKNKIFENVFCSISPASYRHMFALFHTDTGIRGQSKRTTSLDSSNQWSHTSFRDHDSWLLASHKPQWDPLQQFIRCVKNNLKSTPHPVPNIDQLNYHMFYVALRRIQHTSLLSFTRLYPFSAPYNESCLTKCYLSKSNGMQKSKPLILK